MPAPAFMDALFAWRGLAPGAARPYAANQADSDNGPSMAIADSVLLNLGIANVVPRGTTTGVALETAVRDDLATALGRLDPTREWDLRNRRTVADFEQYQHLTILDAAVRANVTLRTEFGREYRVEPDVTIAVTRPAPAPPLLHGVVSCKWSMRSDRVQNVRPEGALLVRHRRGRAPHFVVATCEPLPSRVASIAMTTGEIDRVYHLAFDETAAAVAAVATQNQQDLWAEMVGQRRLRDYNELAADLSLS